LNSSSPQASAVGIHLSGPNTAKTSVVIMTGAFLDGNLKMTHTFEKISSLGRLFSDERLVSLLNFFKPSHIMIDCPMNDPPCVACTRHACPGVNACEDIEVNLMQVVADSLKRRRKRSINPQTQRLWDIFQLQENVHHLQEPSYSANMAPLVVRAKTLQRRLNACDNIVALKETSVALGLRRIVDFLGLPQEVAQSYKAFAVGKKYRSLFLESLVRRGYISLHGVEDVERSVETFQAFIAAFTAALEAQGLCEYPPNVYPEHSGWVYLPDFSSLN